MQNELWDILIERILGSRPKIFDFSCLIGIKKGQNANKNQNSNPHFTQFCVNIMAKIMLGIPH